MNILEGNFPELPSIRQAHAEGKAASEVSFPKVQERIIGIAQNITNKLMANEGVT